MFLARTAEKGFAHGYQRHNPEQTLLYQFIEHHYPEFQALMEAQNRPLPKYVQKEFDEYLKCGRIEYGFLRVRCEQCHDTFDESKIGSLEVGKLADRVVLTDDPFAIEATGDSDDIINIGSVLTPLSESIYSDPIDSLIGLRFNSRQ